MFLNSGKVISRAISELLDRENVKPARFAVAFWGRSSEFHLKGACHIVCDLLSGACNPETIRALRRRPHCVVLHLDGLHAKVVVTSAGAVVSSANMSTNGLGSEGADASGTIEAGYLISADTKEFSEVEAWFDTIWAEARPITEQDLALAQRKWESKNRESVLNEGQDTTDLRVFVQREIDLHKLLKERIDKEDRLRAVKDDVLRIAGRALPELGAQMLGKVATFACHAILCRSGVQLHYSAKGGDPGGTVTEDWIFSRFHLNGAHTRSRVDAVLMALAKDASIDADIREAAVAVLTDSRWPVLEPLT